MMFDQIADALHLAYRQSWAIQQAGAALRSAFAGGFSFKRLIAAIVMAIQSLNFFVFETPMPATGQELDLTGYELVFSEDFDGDALDTDVWRYRGEGSRRGGWFSRSQVSVQDGTLQIRAEYLEDGEFGPGWYAGAIAINKKYNRGYFEIRCICSEGGGFWSAFWIQADHPYDHTLSAGGVGGAELDIFEAPFYTEKTAVKRNAVSQTIHCNGYDDDEEHIDSRILGFFRGDDIYNTYNTYGLEWTEDEYIFYINGVETCRSSFGNGVSEEDEEVIVSLCVPEEITFSPGQTATFTVDYVKIYQKP